MGKNAAVETDCGTRYYDEVRRSSTKFDEVRRNSTKFRQVSLVKKAPIIGDPETYKTKRVKRQGGMVHQYEMSAGFCRVLPGFAGNCRVPTRKGVRRSERQVLPGFAWCERQVLPGFAGFCRVQFYPFGFVRFQIPD